MSQSTRLWNTSLNVQMPWARSTLFWIRQRLNGGGGREWDVVVERERDAMRDISVSLSSHWLHHSRWIGINALTVIVIAAVGNNTARCCWCWHGCCFATTAGVSPSTLLCYAWRSSHPWSRDQCYMIVTHRHEHSNRNRQTECCWLYNICDWWVKSISYNCFRHFPTSSSVLAQYHQDDAENLQRSWS